MNKEDYEKEKDLRYRIKIYRFSRAWFQDFLEGYLVLPEGASVRDHCIDFDSNDYKLKIAHPDWDKVEEGKAAPFVRADFKLPPWPEEDDLDA